MSMTTQIRQMDVEVTDKLFCDGCTQQIPLEFPDNVHGLTEQGRHALQISFGGGYGMFIDPLVQHNNKYLFCEACATKLCAQWECFKRYLPQTETKS